MKTFEFKPLHGKETEILLENPDRGFRMETKMEVSGKEGLFSYDPYVFLDECLEKYKEDRPLITQHYFYLTNYKEKDLDDVAINSIESFFDYCRKKGIKILLRFAYIFHDDKEGWAREDVEEEQIMRHIDQLENVIARNRDVIYAFQAGYLGPWGEWSGGAKQDRKTILSHLLDNIPENLPVQVRYVWIKNVLDKYDMRRARVGYHDDYILDEPHQWNSGAKDDSPYYEQLTEETPYFTVDGEMPWVDDRCNLLGFPIAKRLAKHHFTSFSIEHNYKEKRGKDKEKWARENSYSIERWKTEPVTPEMLTENGMPFNPEWFADADGRAIERSCYEYIRDFLGYHIAAKNAEISKAGRFTEIKLKLINHGFSAPHSMKSCDIVLLDKDNNIIAARPACKLSELQSGNEVTCETYFDGDISAAVRFGFSLKDYGNKGARLANDCEFINGVNILGELEI